jgi:Putative Actinobacterial Holin-X, holin superfamily III
MYFPTYGDNAGAGRRVTVSDTGLATLNRTPAGAVHSLDGATLTGRREIVAETVDEVAASLSEGETEEPKESEEAPSLTELIAELGHDLSVLAYLEGQLAISRNLPEVRRAARDIAAAVVVAIAFLTAFAFVNVAAVYGLSRVVSWWLAALILAAVWIAVGKVLLVALSVRAGRVSGWHWWRVFKEGPEETREDLERARDEAEEAVYDTLGRLAPAVTVEIASAAVPLAGGMATGVVDAGGDLLEASDDIVEAMAEDLPGGSIVNQVWDVVPMPGRFGVKVATTVLKRDNSST